MMRYTAATLHHMMQELWQLVMLETEDLLVSSGIFNLKPAL